MTLSDILIIFKYEYHCRLSRALHRDKFRRCEEIGKDWRYTSCAEKKSETQ